MENHWTFPPEFFMFGRHWKPEFNQRELVLTLYASEPEAPDLYKPAISIFFPTDRSDPNFLEHYRYTEDTSWFVWVVYAWYQGMDVRLSTLDVIERRLYFGFWHGKLMCTSPFTNKYIPAREIIQQQQDYIQRYNFDPYYERGDS